MLAGIEKSEINGLLKLSACIGCDPMLVQGGTGNTSIKIDGVLWIKASGKWLAHAEQEDVLVPVALDEARYCLRENRDLAQQYINPLGNNLKPSIETTMHAVLPHRVVIHVHSINTIAWAVRQDGRAQLADRLDGLRWLWIPYVPSGMPLALEIEQAFAGAPKTDVFVLANHGLVVCGESSETAEGLLCEVERRLAVSPRPTPRPDYGRLMRLTDGSRLCLPDMADLHALGTDANSLEIVSRGVLFPCQAIFFGTAIPVHRDSSWFEATQHSYGKRATRPFVVVEGHGILVNERITRAERAMLTGLMQVVKRIDADAPIRYLSAMEVARVLNAEAHQYRALMESSAS